MCLGSPLGATTAELCPHPLLDVWPCHAWKEPKISFLPFSLWFLQGESHSFQLSKLTGWQNAPQSQRLTDILKANPSKGFALKIKQVFHPSRAEKLVLGWGRKEPRLLLQRSIGSFSSTCSSFSNRGKTLRWDNRRLQQLGRSEVQGEKRSALLCFHEALLLVAGCLHLGVRGVVGVIAELHGRPAMWPSLWMWTKSHQEL